MAIGTIEHKDLPDSLLHEPKGASTATLGMTYVADGDAAGSFQFLPLTYVDFTRTSVGEITPATITSIVTVTGAGLSQTADGILSDVPAAAGIPQTITNKINKNASELLRLYNNLSTIKTDLGTAISALETKVNSLITALETAGVISE